MKKFISFLAVIAIMVATASCGARNTSSSTIDEAADSTSVMVEDSLTVAVDTLSAE